MPAPRTLELALLTAAVLGFRHGFDYDHIAAISDITNVETNRRRAMRMGLLYVLGHAAMVAALGGIVIFYQASLPSAIDRWAERAVGLTLVILGIYVLGTMFLSTGKAAPKSRIMIFIYAFRWLSWRLRRIFRGDAARKREAVNWNCSRKTVFLIGMIHGLGAETPSQLLIFLLAANLGGIQRGLLGLGMFLAGLVLMNTLMTMTAIGIFNASATRDKLMRLATVLTATYSLAVGAIFLFGSAAILPPLAGG
ncbi:MAG TPA: hypothetical protein VGR81_07385 [Candidatus Acidoferrales bacterium]|nr:hypothetical protein [Candidatus Acidoferrales bacterium]